MLLNGMIKKYIYLIFLCLVLHGCKKNIFDYRDKYLGDYVFSVHKIAFYVTDSSSESTFSYNGKIVYGSGDDGFAIHFAQDNMVEITIYEDGTFNGCICSHYETIRGEFASTKQVSFIYDINGLGSVVNYYVTGCKK
jgi:hypothetical protein